jgi:hypothetical protein
MNGIIERVDLPDESNFIVLGATVAGVFVVQSVDRKLYCAAGEVILTVVIL